MVRQIRRIFIFFPLALFTVYIAYIFSAALRNMFHNEEKISLVPNSSNILVDGEYLSALLMTRIPGSESHTTVKTYIMSKFRSFGYVAFEDKFTTRTPFGNVEFSNLLFTTNPNADKFIILAAHYDSKIFKDFNFIGATDSAFPCALLMQLAEDFKKNSALNGSLMFIFFDGEEAFVEWSAADSLFGSRHLASLFKNRQQIQSAFHETEHITLSLQVRKIEIFILLDLLGALNPSIFNFYENTYNWYQKLSLAEDQVLQEQGVDKSTKYFKGKSTFRGYIEDDHIPFTALGVPAVHLIPVPFPLVWHTEADSQSALDNNTIERWHRIFHRFLLN